MNSSYTCRLGDEVVGRVYNRSVSYKRINLSRVVLNHKL